MAKLTYITQEKCKKLCVDKEVNSKGKAVEQGINLGYVCLKRGTEAKRSLEEAIALCKAAGFYALDYLSSIEGDDFLDNAKRERDIMDAAGVRIEQTHCPFFRYRVNGLELFSDAAHRAVQVSRELGAKFMVIHADEWPRRGSVYDETQTLQKNYEVVMPVVEDCLSNGVHPVFENVFDEVRERGERIRFCSTVEEILGLLNKIGMPEVGVCLDTGHAYVSAGNEVLDYVRQLAPHVVCTHIHDNRGVCCGDWHLAGCLGNLDLESVCDILREAGYKGVFTWEMVYGRYPDELLPEFLNLLYKTGQYFIRNHFAN